jgi:hypothetical protein
MDAHQVRECVQRHADAVAAGDMATAFADMTEALQAEMAQASADAPAPAFDHAEVLSIDVGSDESQALIRYSGGGGSATVRSHWRDDGGRPRITRVEVS